MTTIPLRLPLSIKAAARTFTFLSQQRPVITGVTTTTSIAIIGDISCQYMAQKHSNRHNLFEFKWDYYRTLKFGITGFFFAPQMVLWYKCINKIPGNSFKIASKRTFIDQLVFASWTTAYFLSFNKLLDGGDYNDIKQQVNTKWLDTYKANTLLWPPFQFINFWLIPPHFRVLGTNLVSLGWSTYLSFKTHQQ